jgi:hypothetical protein
VETPLSFFFKGLQKFPDKRNRREQNETFSIQQKRNDAKTYASN